MRCIVLFAVVLVMAAARPETYKEKEDFQYSRSSSDDGSKSGYYGAQRGNMGGNYERAHNMDPLAQHQMSGLIHQVDGELGDAVKTDTGSVFTAANSRGIYGSGQYDLGNLEGRNFQEGTSYGNSHSQSALTNSANRDHSSNENRFRNSNRYSHSSRHSNSEQSQYEQQEGVQSSHLRSGDNAYQQEYGAYDGSSRLSHSASPYQNRLVSTRPMKILVRPGTRVTVPIATQTYGADHSASSYNADHSASSYNADHSSSYDSSAYNQHAAKTDAEIIANSAQESHNKQVPSNKHYESSYSYHKEWEKHDNNPGVVPLGIDENAIPKTSELYDDSQHSQRYDNRNQQYTSNTAGSHNSHLSNSYGYNHHTKSNLASSSHSRQQSEYDTQREKLNSDLNAFTNNAHQNNFDVDQQRTTNSKPKSYESSYSYHKSWERQGDPYVIEPVPGVQNDHLLQKLTDSNTHSGYSSHQYGSNHKSSHQSYSSNRDLMDCDCDDEGHIRVARSYNLDQEVQQQQNGWDIYDQQSQNQWDKIQDLGQQTQNKWDKSEDLGQQTQNQWDKIEDLGQQSQNTWDKTEDLTQHTQNQRDKIEDLAQQTQNKWEKIEDLGQQQSENQWDKFEDLGQQTQSKWDKLEDDRQQSQNHWDKFEDFSQHHWENQNLLDQQSQSSVDQDQGTWRKIEKSHKQSDTNNYESQEASASLFEDKHTDIFQSENIISESTTHLPPDNNKHSQNSLHLYDNKNKHLWRSDQSLLNTNMNTISDGETHTTDKQISTTPLPSKEQTTFQNNYSHQQLNENTLSDTRTQHTSSINNLWDKLDRLDRESSLNNIHNTNKYNSLDNEQPSEPSHKNEITTTKTLKDIDKTPKYPKDLGRGDIETEETNTELNTNFDKNDTTTLIEELSLATNKNNVTHPQHNSSDKERTDISLESNKPRSEDNIIHDGQYNHHYIYKETDHQHFDKHEENNEQNLFNQNNIIYTNPNENPDQQNHFDYINHHNENLDQQSMLFDNQYSDNASFNKHNLNQNRDEYGNFDQRNLLHNFQYLDHNVHQENIDKSTLDQQQFDQDVTDEHFGQENVDHNLQSFNKYKENFDQNNSKEQLVDFSKSNDNFDQQSVNQQFEIFNQQNENLDQQNIEQNLQNFDKSSDNFGQENLAQSIDFSVINENYNQQSTNKHYNTFLQENDNVEKLGKNNIFDQQNKNINFDYEKQNEKLEVGIPREDINHQSQNANSAQEINISSQNAAQSNSEYSVINIHQDKKNKAISQQNALTTVAPAPEQTGFWSSVGTKFSKAKDKVASWFQKTS